MDPPGTHGYPAPGGDHIASPVASLVRTLPSHGTPPVIFTCHTTSSFAHGVDVPIPTLPVVSILIVSTLFVLKTRATLSVVPRKLVPATVPELPRIDQTPDTAERDTQLASPLASDDSTLPAHGAPPVIFTCHATSSFAQGAIVPRPILEPSS